MKHNNLPFRLQGLTFYRIVAIKIVLRTAGALILIALGLAATIPFLVRIPVIHSFLESEISHRAGMDLTFHSASWFFRDRVKLSDVRLRYDWGTIPIYLDFQSIRVMDMLSASPRIVLQNSETAAGTASIFSASRTALDWLTDTERLHVGVENARFDPLSLIPILEEEVSGTGADLSTLGSVTISGLRIEYPGIDKNYRWNAALNNESLTGWMDARVNVSAQSHSEENRFDANAQILSPTGVLISLRGSAKRFPLELTEPLPLSMILDGTLSLQQKDRKQYVGETNHAIENIAIALPSSASISIPGATLSSAIILSPTFEPSVIHSRIAHSSVIYQASQDRWRLPPGVLTLDVEPKNRERNPLTVQWNSEAVDRVALTSNEWPVSATSTSALTFRIDDKPLRGFKPYLPKSLPQPPGSLRGRLSLQGSVELLGTNLERYRAEGKLTGGTLRVGPLDVRQASISVNAQGNANLNRAQSSVQAAVAVLMSGTPVLHLEPELRLDVNYNRMTGDLSAVIPEADTSIIHSVSAWHDGKNRWEVEGDFPLEEGIPPLRNAFLPAILSELEGMGHIHLSASSDGNGIQAQAESPDLSVYSFAEALEFGVQLREMSVKAGWNSESGQAGGPAAAWARLRASTPYVSYAGADHEWAGQTVTLSATHSANRVSSLSLSPPGGGAVTLTGDVEKELTLQADRISVEAFLLPLLKRFVLDWAEDETSFKPTGFANAWLKADKLEDSWCARGMVHLTDASFRQETYPQFTVSNATLSIPFNYPIDANSLPQKSLTLTAQHIGWDGASFDNAAIAFPIDATSIKLADDASLPVFGGQMDVRALQITDWQSPAPQLNGSIRLDRLDLEKVSRLSPLFPANGTVSGEIERAAISAESLELSGQLHLDVFGGRMTINKIFFRRAFGESYIAGFDIELDRIDLKELTAYFNFGSMAGTISGFMRNVEVYLPPVGSGELPIPIRLNIEVKSVMKGTGKISRETLEKIYQLGEDNGFAMSAAQQRVKEFDFGGLGLRVVLEGDELRLIGTLKDSFFLSHSRKLFTNTIGIRLPDSDKTLSFKDFWQRLLELTERFPAEE